MLVEIASTSMLGALGTIQLTSGAHCSLVLVCADDPDVPKWASTLRGEGWRVAFISTNRDAARTNASTVSKGHVVVSAHSRIKRIPGHLSY